MRITKYTLLFTGVLFLFSNASLSQTVRVKLHIGYPANAVTDSNDIYFGFDYNATNCIALLGGEFGEMETPPFPFEGYEVRFVNHNPPVGNDSCYGQGSYTDIKNWNNISIVDTFLIKMQAPSGPAANFVWSWPADLKWYFSSLILKDAIFGIFSFDMLDTTSAVTSSTVNQWYIIGTHILDDVHMDNNQIPGELILQQNYPNPFNPSTTIHFDLPRESNVVLKLFDVLGREVRTLLDEKQIAGSYDIIVDGSNLPSGLYFYRLQADNYTETKKLLLLK